MHFIAKKTLQQQPLQKLSPVAIFCAQNNEGGGLNELYRYSHVLIDIIILFEVYYVNEARGNY